MLAGGDDRNDTRTASSRSGNLGAACDGSPDGDGFLASAIEARSANRLPIDVSWKSPTHRLPGLEQPLVPSVTLPVPPAGRCKKKRPWIASGRLSSRLGLESDAHETGANFHETNDAPARRQNIYERRIKPRCPNGTRAGHSLLLAMRG